MNLTAVMLAIVGVAVFSVSILATGWLIWVYLLNRQDDKTPPDDP
jgi:hypothetical protein